MTDFKTRRRKAWNVYLSNKNGINKDNLIRAHMPYVRYLAETHWGNSFIDTDEMYAVGLIGLLEAIEKYNPKIHTNNTDGWVAKFVKFAMINEYRSKRQVDFTVYSSPQNRWPENYDDLPEYGTEINTEALIQQIDIQKIIKKLPSKQQLCLILHFWYDLPMKEIERILGFTHQGSAGVLKEKAIKRLKPLLEEK